MSKGKIILIIILILVILGAFWFFFFQTGDSTIPGETSEDRGFLGIFPRRDSGEDLPDEIDGSVSEEDEEDDTPMEIPDFRQISFKPVSGFGVFLLNGSTTVRFLETETGHIFETNTETLEVTRLSNTTIPRIREALWSGDGSSLLMRYLDDNGEIQSFVATLLKEKEEDEFFSIESSALSEDISYADVFNNSFFAVIDRASDSEWALFSTSGNKTSLATSPLREWVVDFWSSARATLQTKSSSGSSGSLYFLNLNNITLTEILSNVSGLSSRTSPSGNFVAFSSSNESIINILSVGDEEITPINIRTLGEKCAWSNNEEFIYCAVPKTLSAGLPDAWYKGQVLFNDTFWQIDVENGGVEELFDPTSENVVIDAYKIEVSENDDFLFFINKRDGTLWNLDLSL